MSNWKIINFTSIQIYSAVPHTGGNMTKTTPTSTGGRGRETTPTAGTTTGGRGDHDPGWGKSRNLDHNMQYMRYNMKYVTYKK